ncbi:hypothetical protein M407DRAFT_27297 [Tulasnella calospora MUT 4182]|uniref:Uncharacterized protein n=1 Tax=Tulasnella calospora MUT 4182 TaxID=1051891 RepID=A0A0C3QCQ9_9AGAM|nr:hypothetical protein M407DRAFT_27297 [Tulasnella calospora MUT 4182]
MDTIIVELSEFNEHKGRILGEHFWINVFKKIQVEDKQKSSKLYLCPLGNYLELEKQRWRETKVDPDWFKKPWNPNKNSMVNMPYPKTRWCDLPEHHGIDEFCGKIPVSLFPEEEAARAKSEEQPMEKKELSAMTTPGAERWNTAKGEKTRIPTERVRPTIDPASRPQPKQPITRTYRKVETVTTEQSMRAVLVPPMPKHLTLGENGLPNLEPEHFDWFEDVEDEDDAAEWRQQEPPNWELSQLSMEEQRSPAVAPSDNGWNEAPSWDDESEAAGPVASSSNAPEQNPPPPSPPPAAKAQAWQRKSQPARNAWASAAGGPKSKPSPAQSNKSSDTEWQTPGKGKGNESNATGIGRGKQRMG